MGAYLNGSLQLVGPGELLQGLEGGGGVLRGVSSCHKRLVWVCLDAGLRGGGGRHGHRSAGEVATGGEKAIGFWVEVVVWFQTQPFSRPDPPPASEVQTSATLTHTP